MHPDSSRVVGVESVVLLSAVLLATSAKSTEPGAQVWRYLPICTLVCGFPVAYALAVPEWRHKHLGWMAFVTMQASLDLAETKVTAAETFLQHHHAQRVPDAACVDVVSSGGWPRASLDVPRSLRGPAVALGRKCP